MITLNLVSENQKKENKLKHYYKLFKKVDYILLVVAIFVSIMFLVSKILLQNNFNAVVEQTTLITKNSESYNTKVRNINNKINSISLMQKEHVAWAKVLKNIIDMTDENISFSYMNLNQNDNSIKIKGVAQTRESLLALKEKMEKSNQVGQINLPLSNILEKNNISFEINAKLNLN